MTMLKRNQFIIYFILINVGLQIGWNLTFRNNAELTGLGATVLQTASILVGIVYFLKAGRQATNQQKPFWMVLAIGAAIYIAGNLFWLLRQSLTTHVISETVENVLWLISYIVYLIALTYRIRQSNTTQFKRVYLFNVLIFIVTTASILYYYFIEPVLAYYDNALFESVLILVYPVVNLSILLVIAILFYFVQKNKENKVMLFLIAGFFLNILADLYFTYLEVFNSYFPGSSVDYMWLASSWLIVFAGYYAKESNEKQIPLEHYSFKNKEAILPYISTLVLIVLVINSYQWQFNGLSSGAVIIIGMILVRQFFIIRENNILIDEFSYQAYHDPLTGLYNRVMFKEALNHEMNKNRNEGIALLLIDLDRFKVVNDTLGHQVGDKILTKIAKRIENVLESDMQVFRLGGDEFAVIVPQKSVSTTKAVAEKILRMLLTPYNINDHEISLTASIGVSVYPGNGKSYEELFKYADAAMYLAKENGKNGYQFYDDELSQDMARRMRIESDLRKGMQENQFELYYQPKVELVTERIIGIEALLRWKHPELGWISPGEFIPIAEETGQIVAIGEWVLIRACMQNKYWQERGFPALRISVNVSVKQFQNGGLLSIVEKALGESRLDPNFLEIEVTESIMQDIKQSSAILHSLRKMGIIISIDDFGTGYSSLHIIQKLPIDTIKLDKTFIDDIEVESQLAMVKTILNLGENLSLNVVAEGIETDYQLKKLLESNCRIGQGYLFSRPVEASLFEELWRENILLNAGILLEK